MDYPESERGNFAMAYTLNEIGIANIRRYAFMNTDMLSEIISGVMRCAYRAPYAKFLDDLGAAMEDTYWAEEARRDSANAAA